MTIFQNDGLIVRRVLGATRRMMELRPWPLVHNSSVLFGYLQHVYYLRSKKLPTVFISVDVTITWDRRQSDRQGLHTRRLRLVESMLKTPEGQPAVRAASILVSQKTADRCRLGMTTFRPYDGINVINIILSQPVMYIEDIRVEGRSGSGCQGGERRQ